MQTRTTSIPRARFWTLGPNGHAVKLTISPGHSLRWSHPDQDGGHITKVWRHYLDYVCQEVVTPGDGFTQHVAPLDSCAARHWPQPHVPAWHLTACGHLPH